MRTQNVLTKKHIKRIIIYPVLIIVATFLTYVAYELKQIEYPDVYTLYIQKELTVEEKIVIMFPEHPELMLAIAKCESGLNQSAVSHTRDFGVMQINEKTWDSTAEEMGLDYKNSEDDNLEMARHIYEVQGLTAWVCYTKHIKPHLALASY